MTIDHVLNIYYREGEKTNTHVGEFFAENIAEVKQILKAQGVVLPPHAIIDMFTEIHVHIRINDSH